MKISTRSYYGMLATVYLAKQNQTTTLEDIARHEHIPQDFLEKILQQLKKAGFVVSQKGSKGGYRLSKQSQEVTAGDIIRTLEGTMVPFQCIDGKHRFQECPRESMCSTKNVWQTLDKTVNDTLNAITIADLMKE